MRQCSEGRKRCEDPPLRLQGRESTNTALCTASRTLAR